METMGCRIEALIHDKGITQREFADMVGVTPIALSRIIRQDRTPHAPILANIATALGVTIDYLVTGKQ